MKKQKIITNINMVKKLEKWNSYVIIKKKVENGLS